jgi:hypothetical protein
MENIKYLGGDDVLLRCKILSSISNPSRRFEIRPIDQ